MRKEALHYLGFPLASTSDTTAFYDFLLLPRSLCFPGLVAPSSCPPLILESHVNHQKSHRSTLTQIESVLTHANKVYGILLDLYDETIILRYGPFD